MAVSTPVLGEFDAVPSLEQLAAYLQPPSPEAVDGNPIYAHRPYVWFNSVCTMDGVTSFSEPDAMGAPAIAMKSIAPDGARADWRVLNAGRAMADAVLHGGETARVEASFPCGILEADLSAWREQRTATPLVQVLLTRTGRIVPDATIFDAAHSAVILTVPSGAAEVQRCFGGRVPRHVHVQEFAESEPGAGLDLTAALAYLRSERGIRYLDVCAGGSVACKLASCGLLDEIRVTYASQLVGACTGALQRPNVFGHVGLGFGRQIVAQYVGIRLAGPHHLMVRACVQLAPYRVAQEA